MIKKFIKTIFKRYIKEIVEDSLKEVMKEKAEKLNPKINEMTAKSINKKSISLYTLISKYDIKYIIIHITFVDPVNGTCVSKRYKSDSLKEFIFYINNIEVKSEFISSFSYSLRYTTSIGDATKFFDIISYESGKVYAVEDVFKNLNNVKTFIMKNFPEKLL